MKTTSNVELPKGLIAALKTAISSCQPNLREEEGGVVIVDRSGKKFEFIKLVNTHTGTNLAPCLYLANPVEYGQKVISRCMRGDWKLHSSFHTHPDDCPAYPSDLDLRFLFTGFPINFIFTHKPKVLIQHTYNKQQDLWQPLNIKLV